MLLFRREHLTDDQLSACLDAAPAAGRVQEHVDACATCREALDELRAVREALRTMPRATAPRSFALRAADVRPAAATGPSFGLGRMTPVLSGVTMVAALAFFALVGLDVSGGARGGDADGSASLAQPLSAGETAFDAPATTATELRSAEEEAQADEEPPSDGEARGALPEAEATPEELSKQFDVGDDYAGAAPQATPELVQRAEVEDDERTALRIGEAALAAVALVACGALLLAWRRSSG